MPTANSHAQPSRQPSLIDVEVLPMGELRTEALDFYIAGNPERASWPQEKLDRLVIRTECKWGRVEIEGADGQRETYMLNEKGDGPKSPLSQTTCAYVALYAEMRKSDNDPGFFESSPFCKVPINAETARRFKADGLVKLEEFIQVRGAEMEAIYSGWRTSLLSSRERMLEKAKAKRASRHAQQQQKPTSLPTETPADEGESQQEGEQGPRPRV